MKKKQFITKSERKKREFSFLHIKTTRKLQIMIINKQNRNYYIYPV